jgi:hypothetical protein
VLGALAPVESVVVIELPLIVYVPALADGAPLSTRVHVQPPPDALTQDDEAPASSAVAEISRPISAQLAPASWARHDAGIEIVVVMSIVVSVEKVPSLLNVAVPETCGEAVVVAVQPAIVTEVVSPVTHTSEAFHVPTTLPPQGATVPHESPPDELPPPHPAQKTKAHADHPTNILPSMPPTVFLEAAFVQEDTAPSRARAGASSSSLAKMSSAVNGFGRSAAPDAFRMRSRSACSA